MARIQGARGQGLQSRGCLRKLICPKCLIFYTTKMSDSFEGEMLEFCLRYLTKHSAHLSAEQLSKLSVLFPKEPPILSNPLDPTSFTFQWTIAEEPPLSEYIDPLQSMYSVLEEGLEAPLTAIVDTPPTPKRRCPYGYDGTWASPLPVLIAKQLIKRQWRLTVKDVVEKYAKHGETRLTHEIAINYLADSKGMTPEDFLKKVPLPPRGTKTYYGWTGHGNYNLAEW